jgi:hypothetical protein
MSAVWLVALGLSAGYLINRKTQIRNRLEEAAAEFEGQAGPANPGPTSEQLRKVQRTVPVGDRFQDLNLQDLSASDVKKIDSEHQAQSDAAMSWEEGVAPIEGVYLVAERGAI